MPSKANSDEAGIERAGVGDAAEILAVQKAAFKVQGELYENPHIPPLIQTLDETVKAFEEHVVLKAVKSGRIIGSVRGCWRDRCCWKVSPRYPASNPCRRHRR